MHLIKRELYDAAVVINQAETVYEPGNTGHEALLASGIACVSAGKGVRSLIVLTQKGEAVIRLE